MVNIIGLDFGGTSVKAGLVNRKGEIIKKEIIAIDAHGSFDEIMSPVIRWIRAVAKDKEAYVKAVGIGTPGFTDKISGVLLSGSENIPALQGHSIPRLIEKDIGIKAFADNDATCATAGELMFGMGKSYKNFVMITLGTGIGGGLVLNGRVYRGRDGFAGEIGHMCLDPGGPQCNCGSRGCFEQYASGPAIVRLYSEKLKKRKIQVNKNITPRDIFEAGKTNESVALDTIDQVGFRIAQAFGTLLNVLNVDACIIGGGISRAGELLKTAVIRHLPDFVWPQLLKDVEIEIAALQNDAGILGAAAQAYERLI